MTPFVDITPTRWRGMHSPKSPTMGRMWHEVSGWMVGQTGFFNLGMKTALGEEKLRIQTSCSPLKNWPCVISDLEWNGCNKTKKRSDIKTPNTVCLIYHKTQNCFLICHKTNQILSSSCFITTYCKFSTVLLLQQRMLILEDIE